MVGKGAHRRADRREGVGMNINKEIVTKLISKTKTEEIKWEVRETSNGGIKSAVFAGRNIHGYVYGERGFRSVTLTDRPSGRAIDIRGRQANRLVKFLQQYHRETGRVTILCRLTEL